MHQPTCVVNTSAISSQFIYLLCNQYTSYLLTAHSLATCVVNAPSTGSQLIVRFQQSMHYPLVQLMHYNPKYQPLMQRNNVTDTRRGNQEWTIQRNWQHCIHNTQDEDKQNRIHNTICVGHHYTQTNTTNVNNT